MGKAARRKRLGESQRNPVTAVRTGLRASRNDPRARAEAALTRLVRQNPPEKISLAGAYALGYGALAMAQMEGDAPDWFDDLDPLDALFLGTAWPWKFRDGFEFGNARSAWFRLIRGTAFWPGVEQFVREVLAASDEHDLPVDDGELMLLLAGRLEAAGLDQRKVPANLLPDRALASARFISGPPAGLVFPDQPPDASECVRRLRAAASVGLPDDGTPADAMREGLQLVAAAGLDVSDSVVLLPALYIGLVAREDEELAQAGERAWSWALGLSEDSTLIPITDILLAAPERGLDADIILGHLFGVPAFTAQTRTQDRDWHSWPGTELISMAFDLGYPQVISRAGKTIKLSGDAKAILEAQARLFEEKFGRPPGPDDPIFFDLDADELRPATLLDMEASGVEMLEAAGISPAWIYAHQHTGGLLPRPDGTFLTPRDQAEWDDAVTRYLNLHQPGTRVDHQAETRKLRNILASVALSMAADDPGYGADLAAQLGNDDQADTGRDATVLREYLNAWEDDLYADLRDPAIVASACEYARAWAGADLARQVQAVAKAPAAGSITLGVLLAIAVASTQARNRY